MAYSQSGFESRIVHVNCHCEKMRVSPAEKMMAEAEGLDPEYVHKFMDTWERHANVALSLPYEEYENMWNN